MISRVGDRVSRREFLKLGAAGAAFCAGGMGAASSRAGEDKGSTKARIPIALQLYSVRGECEKDLPAVLKEVAKMGYKAVEFAGYYGRNAKQLRALIDDQGLKCCGTHIGLETLLGDELPKTVEFNKTIGNKFLIVPGLSRERTKSAQAWLDTAKVFNDLAEKVKPQEMRVGYHNHSEEFKAVDGKMPWEIFFGNTAKDVVMQVDIGNAMGGGGDPLALIKRFPGRTATIHIKDFSKKDPKALIGDGEVDWKAYFEACEGAGGTEWYIVEYESDAYPPLVSVRKCLENLKKMGK